MAKYKFSKFFELKKDFDEEKFPEILEQVYDELTAWLNNEFRGSILAPVFDIILESAGDNKINAVIEIDIVLNPLSELYSKREEVVKEIADYFFESLKHALQRRGYL